MLSLKRVAQVSVCARVGCAKDSLHEELQKLLHPLLHQLTYAACLERTQAEHDRGMGG